ncbi:MarR family winged helix-turn-helix transcriptional regulator [Xylanimonas allomyrinae]|uniref:MarR family winged helix-turn-helix transcriptional regulator n=1 Tax=Xylanimonas allomyrinae TaxID=2509459 RepID=UPI0013A64920|nr:MarR family winged helix-turn-helix transcriptional regulator [Xylanimonas allomyrinae]
MDARTSPGDVAPLVRFAVLRTARRLRAARDRSALSTNKIAILGHLARNDASTPSRISAEEWQQPQSLTRPLAELEADGLIARSADPADGRRSVLRLTPAGRSAFDADMRARDEWLRGALAHLDTDDLRTLAEAAEILGRLEGDDPRD